MPTHSIVLKGEARWQKVRLVELITMKPVAKMNDVSTLISCAVGEIYFNSMYKMLFCMVRRKYIWRSSLDLLMRLQLEKFVDSADQSG